MAFLAEHIIGGTSSTSGALPNSNNSFVTKWLQIQNSPFASFIAVFSNSGIAGSLYVEVSNNEYGTLDGNKFPITAKDTGAFGTGAYGDPDDLVVFPDANATVAVSGKGPYIINLKEIGTCWMRLHYNATTSVASTGVIVTAAWKSLT